MRKRVDHDATQEVSSSQVVPDKKPPVYPNMPKNDASMWMQTPVSADDFISGPRKKPNAPRSGRGVIVALVVVALLAVTSAGVWYAYLRESPKQTAAYEMKGSAAPAPAPAVATTPVDAAAVATAPADAGVTADAAISAAAAALNADAVSGAGPAAKKASKKRAATKKKATAKKKTATAPKKRR
ncbi:MAG TPA: hypothetical protein VIV40_25705 [Kofleriaceae bacterium]